MPPPSPLSLTLRIGCAVAPQTLDCDDFPEPLPGRFGKMATPAPASRNVVLDGAHRRDLGPVANVEMIVDSHLRAQRHMIANRQATSQSYLGGQQTAPPNRHIVADLDLVVDFRTLADYSVAQAAAVDSRSRPDLHLILDQNAAGLRDLQMAFRPKENEPIAVLADAAAGMDEDPIADQRELDGSARITAKGSTITPSSRCAVGSITAEAAIPGLPTQDWGRRASPWSLRPTVTNARKGWSTRNTATPGGTLASKSVLT